MVEVVRHDHVMRNDVRVSRLHIHHIDHIIAHLERSSSGDRELAISASLRAIVSEAAIASMTVARRVGVLLACQRVLLQPPTGIEHGASGGCARARYVGQGPVVQVEPGAMSERETRAAAASERRSE